MRDGIVIVSDPYTQVDDIDGDPVAHAGQVYVFDRYTGDELAILRPENSYEDLFGWSVGADADTIYAGSWRLYGFNSYFGPDYPRVERFDAMTFERKPQMLASYSLDEAYFGRSIAVSDEYTVVGMSNGHYQTSFVPELGGAIFVYDTSRGYTCPPDLNTDGVLNFFDVSLYILAYTSGDLAADYNGDGNLNFFDVSEFIFAFTQGCP